MHGVQIEHLAEDDLPLIAHKEQVDALEDREDATQRGSGRGFALLVREGLALFSQSLAQLALSQSVHEQS